MIKKIPVQKFSEVGLKLKFEIDPTNQEFSYVTVGTASNGSIGVWYADGLPALTNTDAGGFLFKDDQRIFILKKLMEEEKC